MNRDLANKIKEANKKPDGFFIELVDKMQTDSKDKWMVFNYPHTTIRIRNDRTVLISKYREISNITEEVLEYRLYQFERVLDETGAAKSISEISINIDNILSVKLPSSTRDEYTASEQQHEIFSKLSTAILKKEMQIIKKRDTEYQAENTEVRHETKEN